VSRARSDIVFRPLTTSDLPLLHEWLARPHVAEWWGRLPSAEELEGEFIPANEGSVVLQCYLAILDDEPVGFMQSYVPALCHDDGWWLDEHDPGVRGIDLFLANAEQLGRGLGSAMVRAFVARLFDDATVARVQIDPSPDNLRAIRCYERAGFRAVGEVDTPDGCALLMYLERPQASRDHADGDHAT
jgi:aminoglycoside 6'-N-acetyltransferase-1b